MQLNSGEMSSVARFLKFASTDEGCSSSQQNMVLMLHNLGLNDTRDWAATGQPISYKVCKIINC